MVAEATSYPRDRRLVISALGVAQILAWGTSFYLPAVFAGPIVADTGWSLGWVVGGTSVGLLVAGLISPQVGRIIDLHGGRPVLLASSLFYATGLIAIGLSPALPVYLFAWVLLGIGMGTGLYDAVFAALGRIYGSAARGPITNLTLFGGFASTICWPLSAFMIEHIGWREACFVYAGLHLVVALPLQMAVIRRAPKQAVADTAPVSTAQPLPPARIANEAVIFALLALVLSIAAGVGSIVIVSFMIFLQARGVGGQPRHAVRPGAGLRPRHRTLVRQPLPSDLDHDRLLRFYGDRAVAAGRAFSVSYFDHPDLRRWLRHFVDRARHAAAGAVRAD
jgi:MFS family permease